MTDRAIVTLNQVKYYLNIQVANTSKDEVFGGSEDGTVEGLIDLVSKEFEEAIQNKVQPYTYEEFLSGNGRAEIGVRYWPVTTLYGADEAARLANLQYRDTVTSSWTDLLSEEDYVWLDPLEPWKIKILESNDFFPKGERNVRIKYTAGYSEIPSDITLAVLERVAMKYKESSHDGARLGVESSGSGGMGGQTQNFTDHQDRWDAVVSKYRRWV